VVILHVECVMRDGSHNSNVGIIAVALLSATGKRAGERGVGA
jgi:hypothetical protein